MPTMSDYNNNRIKMNKDDKHLIKITLLLQECCTSSPDRQLSERERQKTKVNTMAQEHWRFNINKKYFEDKEV